MHPRQVPYTQAEIANLYVVVGVYEQICCLQITMNEHGVRAVQP